MKLSESLAKKLKKYGYSIKSNDELFESLPKTISSKNGKSIKYTPVVYFLKIDNDLYTLFALVNFNENEPKLLQKEMSKNRNDVVAKMLVFLNKSGLLEGE